MEPYKRFLFYLLSYLKKHHFSDVVLSVGYLKEQIQEYFGNNFLGLNIKYAIENEPLGTGGAIINSLKLIDKDKPVVILNGDSFLEISYQKLIANHQQNKAYFTIALKEMNDCSRYGKVEINQNNIITDFKEKPKSTKAKINGGFFVANYSLFNYIDNDNNEIFEQNPIGRLVKKKELMQFNHDGFWQPMDSQKEFKLLNDLYKTDKAPWKIW